VRDERARVVADQRFDARAHLVAEIGRRGH